MSEYFSDHKEPDVGMAALLLEMHGDLKVIKTQTAGLNDAKKDHETRIRNLEKFRHAIPSVALITAMGACVTAALSFH